MAGDQGASARGTGARVPRKRRCLAAGCTRRYTPRCWHQRYCGEECRKRVRRWLAAKRQQRRRSTDEGREAHRAAERARRERGRAATEPASEGPRGHGASGPICDRPGCFATPLRVVTHAACFCNADCRVAVKRVLEREHKWLARGALRGDALCGHELERRRAARAGERDRLWRSLLERHRREADDRRLR